MISVRNYLATIEYNHNICYLCNKESNCSFIKKISLQEQSSKKS